MNENVIIAIIRRKAEKELVGIEFQSPVKSYPINFMQYIFFAK